MAPAAADAILYPAGRKHYCQIVISTRRLFLSRGPYRKRRREEEKEGRKEEEGRQREAPTLTRRLKLDKVGNQPKASL